MKAALLNTRIEILRRVAEEDESGAVVHRWTTAWCVWADFRHVSGRETVKQELMTASVRASVRIRYRHDMTADMRVRAAGVVYRIVSVLPDVNRRVFVDLVCESLPDEI